jgi:hypothetical protein
MTPFFTKEDAKYRVRWMNGEYHSLFCSDASEFAKYLKNAVDASH